MQDQGGIDTGNLAVAVDVAQERRTKWIGATDENFIVIREAIAIGIGERRIGGVNQDLITIREAVAVRVR